MIRRPPRSTLSSSSAASDVYKRQVDGRAWPDRRALVPDGRAATGYRGRPDTCGSAGRHRALPRGRGRPGQAGGSLDGRGALAAHHPRDPAPARVRPCRARGGEGDVRAAATAPAHLPRRPMNGVPVGWLLAIAVVATVVAALLSAGETAVLRSSSSGTVIPEKLGAVARRRRLLADAHGTAAV